MPAVWHGARESKSAVVGLGYCVIALMRSAHPTKRGSTNASPTRRALDRTQQISVIVKLKLATCARPDFPRRVFCCEIVLEMSHDPFP